MNESSGSAMKIRGGCCQIGEFFVSESCSSKPYATSMLYGFLFFVRIRDSDGSGVRASLA